MNENFKPGEVIATIDDKDVKNIEDMDRMRSEIVNIDQQLDKLMAVRGNILHKLKIIESKIANKYMLSRNIEYHFDLEKKEITFRGRI